MRTSVSAEAYGVFNKKEDFKAPYYEKTAEVQKQISDRLAQSFMFSALSDAELKIVIGAMQSTKLKPQDIVIREGEDGDNLYVVESGKLKCYKKLKKEDAEPTVIKEYQQGDAFGELALLYNCPRAATIEAVTDAELWSLDR